MHDELVRGNFPPEFRNSTPGYHALEFLANLLFNSFVRPRRGGTAVENNVRHEGRQPLVAFACAQSAPLPSAAFHDTRFVVRGLLYVRAVWRYASGS